MNWERWLRCTKPVFHLFLFELIYHFGLHHRHWGIGAEGDDIVFGKPDDCFGFVLAKSLFKFSYPLILSFQIFLESFVSLVPVNQVLYLALHVFLFGLCLSILRSKILITPIDLYSNFLIFRAVGVAVAVGWDYSNHPRFSGLDWYDLIHKNCTIFCFLLWFGFFLLGFLAIFLLVFEWAFGRWWFALFRKNLGLPDMNLVNFTRTRICSFWRRMYVRRAFKTLSFFIMVGATIVLVHFYFGLAIDDMGRRLRDYFCHFGSHLIFPLLRA